MEFARHEVHQHRAFELTFALFVMFHGANSPGGGFQGEIIAESVE